MKNKSGLPITVRRVAVDAERSLTFRIIEDDVLKAECRNPNACVIAQSLKRAVGAFEAIEVGASITKIFVPGQVIRYSTPKALHNALRHFDNSGGEWLLPPGEYTLLPPSKTARLGGRPSRWHKHLKDTSKTGRDMFGGRALPTRRTTRLGGKAK